jgi:transcriptional regulator with XRE-family HTH domain
MKNIQNKYPNKLKEIRKTKNLTQLDVAKQLGMKSQDRISHWEKGQSIPSVINLFKICKLYNVKPEDVYL